MKNKNLLMLALLVISISMTACTGTKLKRSTLLSEGGNSAKTKPIPNETFSSLRLHPENPRYFQDIATGNPIVFVGYQGLVPTSRVSLVVNNFEKVKASGLNYTRIWHFLPWEKACGIFPWVQISGLNIKDGEACDMNIDVPSSQRRIYDLTKWNDEYWTRLRATLKQATEAGIVSEIMLFEHSGMKAPAWNYNPWATNNNINSLESSNASGSGFPTFYESAKRPKLRQFQEEYIKKMIDETIGFNVVYEVENEHDDFSDATWATQNGQFIKNYIATKYPGKTRLVSYSSLDNELEDLYKTSDIDIINIHPLGEIERYPYNLSSYIEGRWGFAKPINNDEFGNHTKNEPGLRNATWMTLLSGGHIHIEEPDVSIDAPGIILNMQKFIKQSGWDFIHAAPNRRYSFGGNCMIQPGVEYVCYYYFNSAKKSLSVAAGNYQVKWWNPRVAGYADSKPLVHAGGVLSLTPPSSTESWVLHIKSDIAPTFSATLTAPPAHSCSTMLYNEFKNLTCPTIENQFGAKVKAAQATTMNTYSEIFDKNDMACGDCPFVKDPGLYHWLVSEHVSDLGLCATWDNEELLVKNSNNFSENYDIHLGSGHVWGGGGKYFATCSPAQVIWAPQTK